MQQPMQPLKPSYVKNTYQYQLLERTGRVALFRQMDGHRTVAYETGYIKRRENDAVLPNGTVAPAAECFWSNEDIGRIAWSYVHEHRARTKYAQLVEEERNDKASTAAPIAHEGAHGAQPRQTQEA